MFSALRRRWRDAGLAVLEREADDCLGQIATMDAAGRRQAQWGFETTLSEMIEALGPFETWSRNVRSAVSSKLRKEIRAGYDQGSSIASQVARDRMAGKALAVILMEAATWEGGPPPFASSLEYRAFGANPE